MLVKADLHNHLRTSSNVKEGDFNRAIDVAQKRLGFNGTFGLINFADARYENFANSKGYERQNIGNAVYIPEKNILVVKGQEVRTKEGHLLVLGLKQNTHLKSGTDIALEDAIKEAKDNNGILIADHPFYREGIGRNLQENPELLKKIDGMEIFNGEAVFIPGLTPRKANKKAMDFFEELERQGKNIGGIASSDGHSLYELGKNYTLIPQLNISNSEALIESLRQGIKEAPSNGIKTHTSRIGAYDHILDLAFYAALKKLHIKVAFENLKR